MTAPFRRDPAFEIHQALIKRGIGKRRINIEQIKLVLLAQDDLFTEAARLQDHHRRVAIRQLTAPEPGA